MLTKYKKPITAYITEAQKEEIKQISLKYNISVSQYLRNIIEEKLETMRKKKLW